MPDKLVKFISILVVVLFCGVLVSACEKPMNQLDTIKQRGELRVVTRNSPTTYYIGRDGKTGLEYEMISRFARELDVNLDIILAKNTAEIIELITNNKADIAAAALSKAYQEEYPLMFGPSYQWVTRQVVYRNGQRRPASLDDIYPNQLDVANGSIQLLHLTELREQHPNLSWRIHTNKDDHELLEMIENGEIVYTAALSNELAQARQYNPEIRAAFNLTMPEPLAWAIKRSDDHSLLSAIRQFHRKLSQDGKLADLIERFYGPVEFFDYVDSRMFVDRFVMRLPKLKPLFEQAADIYNFDWRLLAAVSYQESHWNAMARSPTGVRGLMMLTLTTAQRVGINNRLDPAQSIAGGAKYLTELVRKVPDRIPEPDRIWLALAAYNVGFGHLEDARVLTERQGGNPDNWQDVKIRLPLLSKRAWYKQTKHGYARGYEPVKYVEKIKKYYNLIVQMTQPVTVPSTEAGLPEIKTLTIDSPVL